jgi:hypothetical protein
MDQGIFYRRVLYLSAFFLGDRRRLVGTKGQRDKIANELGTRKPDYSAYVFLGVTTDETYYVDADLDNRRDTTKMVADGINYLKHWKPHVFALEINGFQELLKAEFIRQARSFYPPPHLPLWGIGNYRESKDVRIQTLGPLLAQRKFRFKRGSRRAELLVQQLRDFPVCEKKDGPDALEMAVRSLVFLIQGRIRPRADAPQPLRA